MLAKKPAARRPNIVLIVAENLGASMLGCYGNREARTPNIDLLARQGTRLNHYACAPAPVEGLRTLLTGRTPRQKDGSAIMDILGGQGYTDQQTSEKPFLLRVSFSGDDQLPPLLSKLEKQGLRDHTLVVFTSTNGPSMGSDPPSMREEVVATPMIWNWPGRVPVEGIRPELVSAYDLVPSLCEVVGIPVPANLCGRSYLNLVLNKPMPKKRPWRSLVFADYQSTQMARDKRYKLVLRNAGKGPNEFYDLVADPREKANQYANPRFNTMRDLLATELATWLKR